MQAHGTSLRHHAKTCKYELKPAHLLLLAKQTLTVLLSCKAKQGSCKGTILMSLDHPTANQPFMQTWPYKLCKRRNKAIQMEPMASLHQKPLITMQEHFRFKHSNHAELNGKTWTNFLYTHGSFNDSFSRTSCKGKLPCKEHKTHS